VLDVGVELLEEGGYPALTIAALCERSGLTPPAVYARAGSKELLLLAIYEHATARINADDRLDPDDPAWTELPPDGIVRGVVTGLADIWLGHARILRPIVSRGVSDAEIGRRGSASSRDLATRCRRILLLAQDAMTVPDPPAAVDLCFRLVYSTLTQRIVHGPTYESDIEVDDALFVTQLGDAAVRVLGIADRS
jgi:AcrR family transcriptional regulator